MHSTRLALASILLMVAGATGCTDDSPDADPSPSDASDAAPTLTPEFDSMVAMGHSAITGYGSEGEQPAPANSWATGDNPAVVSIYQRLLATYPEFEGHNYNVAVDGAPVDDLVRQAEELAALESVPDVVIIQILGNDIRCDGSDPDNYEPYGATIDGVLTTIEGTNPNARVAFVHHWSSMEQYAATLAQIDGARSPFGSGRCGILTRDGEPIPKGITYLQSVFDGYYDAIATACAGHSNCVTDGGGLQATPLAPEDLAGDLIHLTVSGQAKEAATAWELLSTQLS